jgi:hypothetical protein
VFVSGFKVSVDLGAGGAALRLLLLMMNYFQMSLWVDDVGGIGNYHGSSKRFLD